MDGCVLRNLRRANNLLFVEIALPPLTIVAVLRQEERLQADQRHANIAMVLSPLQIVSVAMDFAMIFSTHLVWN